MTQDDSTPARSPSLADFTCEALILPQMQARDKAAAIRELNRAFPIADPRWDAEKLSRAVEAFRWGGWGSPKVRFVFLNAVPSADAMGYLKLISGLARLGKDPALLEQFKTAATARELFELLGKIPVRK